MSNVIFGGLNIGLIYALVALSLALVFRSGGVFNLGLASTSGVAVYMAVSTLHWTNEAAPLVLVTALLLGGLLSGASYVTIMAPIEQISPLNATLATLGLGIAFDAVSLAVWGPSLYAVPSVHLFKAWFIFGGVINLSDWGTLVAFLVVVVLLWLVLLRTRFGIVLRAVGQGSITAGALGIRVRWVKAGAWAVAGALGTAGAVLSAGNTGMSSGVLDNLLVAAFAGVVVGGFDSMVGVAVGSLVVGVGEGILAYLVAPWLANVAVFVVVLVLLMIRPNGLFGHHPHLLNEQSLPGRVHHLVRGLKTTDANAKGVAYLGVIAIFVALLMAPIVAAYADIGMTLAIQAALAESLMVMGLYVVMGLNGQLALGLGAFGAFGAYPIAYLSAHWSPANDLGVAIPLALIVGGFFGALLGLPCARLKGIYLGVLTVIFSAAVSEYAINASWTGAGVGLAMPTPKVFGTSIQGGLSYTIFEAVVAAVALVVVVLIRHSGFGLSLITLRDAESAALASGLSAPRYRVIGFAVGAALVSVGGVLLAESVGLITSDIFDLTYSLNLQAAYVMGGMSSIGGGLFGSAIFGIVPQIAPSSATYLPGLILGGGLVIVLRFFSNGLGYMLRSVGAYLLLMIQWLRSFGSSDSEADESKPLSVVE